jgi:hypothetical protein
MKPICTPQWQLNTNEIMNVTPPFYVLHSLGSSAWLPRYADVIMLVVTIVSGLRMQCRAWRASTSSRTALLIAKLGMHVWSAGFHGSAERVRSVMFRDRGTGEVPGVHQIDQLTTISAYSTGVAVSSLRHGSYVDTEGLGTKIWPVETGICKWVIPSPDAVPNREPA